MKRTDVYYSEDDYGIVLTLGCQVSSNSEQGNFLANPFQDKHYQSDTEQIKACKKLYIAIIFRAIQDLEGSNSGESTEQREEFYKRAMKFFFPVPTRRFVYPVTFQDCCDALGLDSEYFLVNLKRMLKKKREFRRRFVNSSY